MDLISFNGPVFGFVLALVVLIGSLCRLEKEQKMKIEGAIITICGIGCIIVVWFIPESVVFSLSIGIGLMGAYLFLSKSLEWMMDY